MSHLSPSVFLLWALLTTALGIFYFNHLWKFDRLRCLNIARGPNNGAFRRVMTYSYLLAVPLLFSFSAGFAVIKYKEGYIVLPSGAAFPKPYEQWTPEHQAATFPLTMMYALSWVAEVISHLEELCFWLFLIHAGPTPTPWFNSIYFKIWAGGSVSAMVLLPVVAATTADNSLKNEAWVQFVGSTIGLLITLGFLPILWVFPSFVQNVKDEGADQEAVSRLAKFHDLNITRIAFRFLFVIPVLMLSIDGLTPHTHTLNDSLLGTDLLAMASGLGCFVQSTITLLIFFPRNVELETQRWLRESPTKPRRINILKAFKKDSKASSEPSSLPDRDRPSYLLTDSPIPSKVELLSAPYSQHAGHPPAYPPAPRLPYEGSPQGWDDAHSMYSLDKQWHGPDSSDVRGSLGLTEANLRRHSDVSRVNPMALSFTSPINVGWLDDPQHQGGPV